jgi:hypothetical protein
MPMSQPFFSKPTPETERIVRESQSFTEMVEALKAAGRQSVDATPESAAALPASGYKYEKTITFDPESGKRNLVIRADSAADLAALEAQILGYH